MKKLMIVSIAAVCFTIQTKAQVTFGIKGGFSLASQMYKADNSNADALVAGFNKNKKSLPAFHGGVTADIPVSEHIVIQPGFQFAQKGVKFETELSTTTHRFNYLELPVNVLYRQSAEGGFFGGVGPYAAYAMSGKTGTKIGNNAEIKEKFDFDKNQARRFDFGGNVMIGYELPMGVTIGANYSLGFISFSDPKTDGVITKNNYLGISVGYKFKK